MKRGMLLVLLALLATPAAAKIYKWVMPDGRIVYSDTPPVEGAKEVKLPPLQVYHAKPITAPAGNGAPSKKKAAAAYREFSVAAPENDSVVRDNGGIVTVRLKLVPPLRPGHQIEILLDGKTVGTGTATGLTLTNVDRGTHTLSAVVRDATGAEVARAPGSTFHLKHTFIRRPKKPASP